MAFQIRRAHRFLPPPQDHTALTISTSAKNGKVPAAWTESSPGNTYRRLAFPSVNHSAYSVRDVNGQGHAFLWGCGLWASQQTNTQVVP